MNRFRNLVDDQLDSATVSAATLAANDWEHPTELDEAHCLYTPLHYERNYAYPLVVWLHGPDDDERQVTQVMPLVSLRNYVGVGPRGTVASNRVAGGFGWSQDRRHIARAEQRVLSAVEAAGKKLNIAASRVYLAGYQSGGTMAFRIALDHPDMFAGVLSLGGAFPSTLRPLGQLHAARNLKTFLAVGRQSKLYPESRVCDDLRLFHAAGMSLNLRLYPCGDEVLSNMLSDMDRWIMEQVATHEPVAQDQPDYRLDGR